MKNNNIDKYIFKKDLFDISPSSNSFFQHILHRVPRIRSSFDSRDHPFRSSLDERRTQLPSNQEYEFSSKLVRTKSKTSSISIGSFLFLFLFSTLSSSSSFFYIQCPLSPWLGHAYQSGKRFTDSDWYSDNENSTSPFARILLKSPPR